MAEIYKVRQLLSDATPELTYEEDSFLAAAQVYAKEFGLLPIKEVENPTYQDYKLDLYVSKPNGFRVIVTFTLLSKDTPYVQKISMLGCRIKGDDSSRFFSDSFSQESAALSYITELMLEKWLVPNIKKGTTVFVHNLETDLKTEVLVSYRNQPIPYIKKDIL